MAGGRAGERRGKRDSFTMVELGYALRYSLIGLVVRQQRPLDDLNKPSRRVVYAQGFSTVVNRAVAEDERGSVQPKAAAVENF